MDEIIFKTEKRLISDLLPHEKNPRSLTTEQFEQLEKSLSKFGLVEIPVINTDNTILAGHMRLKVLETLKGRNYEIEVRVPEQTLSEKDAEEYLLRSNKNTGEWDIDGLLNFFDSEDLEDVGFKPFELGIDSLDFEMEEVEEFEKPEPTHKNISIKCDLETYEKLKPLVDDAKKQETNLGLILLKALENG